MTITTGPGQARNFQLVLTNTREEDVEQEKEEDTPKQIGVVVEQVKTLTTVGVISSVASG